jgi:hypothetical protein
MSGLVQFLRCESFSLSPSKLKKRRKNSTTSHRSAQQVVDELVREPHATPHVPNPQRPQIILGNPYQLLANAQARSAGATDTVGRKMRKDAHIIAGCIVSYPKDVNTVIGNTEEMRVLYQWIDKTAEWAQKEFGKENVDTVVLHTDETMPHLHIMLIPPAPGVNPSPIRRKQREVGRANKNAPNRKVLENNAYNAEAVRLQDSLFAGVSHEFGHARISDVPGPRLGQKDKGKLKKKLKEVDDVKEAYREMQKQVSDKEKMLTQTLTAEKASLEKEREALELREVNLSREALKFQKLVLTPVVALVESMVRRVLEELPNHLPEQTAKTVASALRRIKAEVQREFTPDLHLGKADVKIEHTEGDAPSPAKQLNMELKSA